MWSVRFFVIFAIKAFIMIVKYDVFGSVFFVILSLKAWIMMVGSVLLVVLPSKPKLWSWILCVWFRVFGIFALKTWIKIVFLVIVPPKLDFM